MNRIVLRNILPVALWAVAQTASAQKVFARTDSVGGDNMTYWTAVANPNDAKILRSMTWKDNWFAGLEMAGSTLNFGSYQTKYGFIKKVRPAFGFYVANWLSPTMGFRAHFGFLNNQGTVANGKKYNWNTSTVYLEALFHFNSIFGDYREKRRWTYIGIFGIGMENTFGFSKRSWNNTDLIKKDQPTPENVFSPDNDSFLSLRAGLMLKYRINNVWEWDVELTANSIHDTYDGVVEETNKWGYRVNLMTGLSYRFKNHDGSRGYTYQHLSMNGIRNANDEIERLRDEVEKLRSQADEEARRIHHINTLISFQPGSANIDTLQLVNVFTAADQVKKHKYAADLYITRRADTPMDNTLFLQRAMAIRDRLINHYFIPAGIIYIEPNPEVIAAINPETDCIIMTMNTVGEDQEDESKKK